MYSINCNTCNKEMASNKTIRFKNKTLTRNIVMAVITVVIIIAVTGCKAGMDSRVYNYGTDALEAVDNYLDGAIQGVVAVNKLEVIENKLKQLGDLADSTSVSTEALLVRVRVSSVKWEVSSYYKGFFDTTNTDVINARNELAEALNKKHR